MLALHWRSGRGTGPGKLQIPVVVDKVVVDRIRAVDRRTWFADAWDTLGCSVVTSVAVGMAEHRAAESPAAHAAGLASVAVGMAERRAAESPAAQAARLGSTSGSSRVTVQALQLPYMT